MLVFENIIWLNNQLLNVDEKFADGTTDEDDVCWTNSVIS